MSDNKQIHANKYVLFTGYYGAFNTGDDAFCVVSSWGAKHIWNAEKIGFLCGNLPKLPCAATQVFTENGFKGKWLLDSSIHLMKASAAVFSGGSIFHRVPHGLNLRNVIKFFHRIKNLPIGAIGVSVGPFTSGIDEKRVKSYLKQLSFLALRDYRSFQIASSMNLPYKPVLAFDLAGLLPIIYGKRTQCEKQEHTLGISVCRCQGRIGGN